MTPIGRLTLVPLLAMAASRFAADGGKAQKVLTVSPEGGGDYRTIQDAVNAVPDGWDSPISIRIKPGTYVEHLNIPKTKSHLSLVGDDAAATVLTFNLHANLLGPDRRPIGTFRTASTVVYADDFTAENLTFANSTPRDVSQALAIACNGDRQVFRNCRFLGWQDTVYLDRGRIFFDKCYVEGGVDFIFGPATAVFRDCEIRSKRKGYLTAASTPQDHPFGFVFLNCRLTATDDLEKDSVYLGRPWRDYGAVTYINCDMGPHIRKEGWDNWRNPAREKTARYSEYHSTGPRGDATGRVPWSHQLTDEQARAITVQSVLAGPDHWNPTATP